ncbi:hypothetical protein AOC36_09125 [Erysipelothrix larvae]|uniref:Methylated-DNA-[protein]-cysteine S-methyltransferase DNA binding domain-containing protein n=1 Tax=Erysipelothrix larvae TaxID=1514105 RepID=A0A0X8H1A9_9FIRM|nr:MGMT family protein [Erysipelothrix larvae]AMC94144.1 hypothetical protein AOC36_09125 [Erysipelothrix larvae]
MDELFVYLVLAIVEEIPRGYVSTYGDVAKRAGAPKNARLIGKILSHASMYGDYPCHRVVNHNGRLVPGWDEQYTLLLQEHITFLPNGCVNLANHRLKG